jgi:hypothetical protein
VPRPTRTDDLLNITETLLKAQLQAIDEMRRQRAKAATAAEEHSRGPKHMSQTAMAADILTRAGEPLHVLEIIERIKTDYGLSASRDSLVSAILKKAAKGEGFVKTGKNTYGLLGRDKPE